jgi:hypothetical protein
MHVGIRAARNAAVKSPSGAVSPAVVRQLAATAAYFVTRLNRINPSALSVSMIYLRFMSDRSIRRARERERDGLATHPTVLNDLSVFVDMSAGWNSFLPTNVCFQVGR